MNVGARLVTVKQCYIPLLKVQDDRDRLGELEECPELLSSLCKYFMGVPFEALVLEMAPFSSSNILFLFKRVGDPDFVSQKYASFSVFLSNVD